MLSIKFCVSLLDMGTPQELIMEIMQLKNRLAKMQSFKKYNMEKCFQIFISYRRFCLDLSQKYHEIEEKMNQLIDKYLKKTKFLKTLTEKGIHYLNPEEYENFARTRYAQPVTLLFIGEKFDSKKTASNIRLLAQFKKEQGQNGVCAVVDVDVSLWNNNITDSVIQLYSNGSLVLEDVEKVRTEVNCASLQMGLFHADAKPPKAALCVMSCPVCKGPPGPWKCIGCKQFFETGFNGKLYCRCGSVYSKLLGYKCSNYWHMKFDLIAVDVLKKQMFMIKQSTEINLLLIGQSGVGKSTWINGFPNYLAFQKLDKAETADTITLIPGQFTILDDNYEEHRVVTGSDGNEASAVGESATQNCRSYVIYHNNRRITLIDTPGLGDTRGYTQDMNNIKEILRHLKATTTQIHGVCFLLLPSENRSNAMFRYCFKEMLSFFHRNITKNLIICFTHSRSTFYKPGESLGLLKNLLDDTQQEQPISKDNIFCFDNESYKYLCVRKQNIPIAFSQSDQESYAKSWQKAYKETNRLLNYVEKLPPYETQLTTEIGKVRFEMMAILKRMYEMTNVQTASNLTDEIAKLEDEIEDYKKNSSFNQVTVEAIPGQHNLVCTGPNCVDIRGGTNFYKQICHQKCSHSYRFNVMPNVDVLNCICFNGKMTCNVCNCRYEDHMMINYSQMIKTERKQDPTVARKISQLQIKINLKRNMILQKESDKKEAQMRHEDLFKLGTKLARLLASNAMYLYNDAIEDFVDCEIENLDMRPSKTDTDKKRLIDLKLTKEKAKKMVEIMFRYKKIIFATSSTKTLEQILTPEWQDMLRDYQVERESESLFTDTVQRGHPFTCIAYDGLILS